jgi:hypothetical protein
MKNYLLFYLVVSSKLLLEGSDAANKVLLEMVNAGKNWRFGTI